MIIPEFKPGEPAMVPAPMAPQPFSAKLDETLLKSGTFYLNGEFNDEHITPLVKQITAMNMLEEKQRPEQITIHINSPGGTVWNLWQLTEVIAASKIPVSTVCSGLAASCGFLLLMSGHKGLRFATKNASLMSHQYAWGSKGKHHELIAKQDEFKRSEKRMVEHYVKHTKKTKTYILKHLLPATDVWMDASAAKRHGAIDKVI